MDTFGSDNTSTNMQAYLDEAYSTKKLAKELRDLNSFFFFACSDKTILGYLKLNVNNAQTEKMPQNTLWLGVWENNPVALKFYSKLGFEQIGDHIFQLGDDLQRDLIMQKRLGPSKLKQ